MSQAPIIDLEKDNFKVFNDMIEKDPELPANLGTYLVDIIKYFKGR